ncbi:glycosyltransferase [Paenibacillus sp. PR3]|uniref:Glycosyltransferase n=1 Tax=Paenibacillus terricola TaxID=2763503 RepID=A0ABR8MY12_9BACL|nr:glycosyltransferase [Paenibacillus terricola]MBD3920831.1 glycosyltransferase [Paenibacillus terricola]
MCNLISLCMIVKNEENVLARCLDSVKTLVDEIIIVDTGSNDQTKQIALQYTDRVYDFCWNNDFAAARNESIRHATGKWILVLDADEYMSTDGHQQLRDLLQNNANINHPIGFTLNILNFTGSGYDEQNVMASTGARLFFNDGSIRYNGIIHEQLVSNLGHISFSPLPITTTIYHTGYTDSIVRNKNKSERNLALFEKINTIEKQHDPYFCFTLGNEYSNAERNSEALTIYRRSYAKSKPADAWYYHLLDRYISLLLKEGKHSEASSLLKKEIKLAPLNTDLHCMEGLLYETLGLWTAAEEKFLHCIDISNRFVSNGRSLQHKPVQPTYAQIVPHQMLAEIARKRGDFSRAINHWVKTLQLQPKNYNVLQRLIEHLLLFEPVDAVIPFIERIYPPQDQLNSIVLFKISLKIGNRKLIEHYGYQIDELHINLDISDLLIRRMSQKESLHEYIQHDLQSVPDSLAVTSAILSKNLNFIPASWYNFEVCKQLSVQAMLVLEQKDWNQETIIENEELLANVILNMWKYEYIAEYTALIQNMANTETINFIANWFYDHGLIELAIDLYSILLDNEALQAQGHANVGQWYYNNGNTSDGTMFYKAAFATAPSLDVIGRIKENADKTDYRSFSPNYFNMFPDKSTCVFL